MKILHLNDHYTRVGGAETLLFNTLSALEEQGVRNAVVYQHPSHEPTSQRRAYRVPELGEIRPSIASRVAESLREIVRTEQPDLIHLHDIGNPNVFKISARLAPTVQNVLNHSFYCPGGMKYLPFLGATCHRPFGPGCLASAFLTHCNSVRPAVLLSTYRRSHQMLNRTDNLLFLVLSRYQARCLEQSGCSPKRIRILAPFTEPPELPGEEFIPTRPPTLLFTGRIVVGKGLHVLMEALGHLRTPFRLIVDGDGPDLERARQIAQQLGLSDHVDFVGWAPREKHWTHYAQASVVAVPSLWPEAFCLVGIEAMSWGKPVVAFRTGGIPEWLEDGVTGYLVEPGDARRMADRIGRLLENPEEGRRMGRTGRDRARRDYGKTRYVSELLKIYAEIARN